MPQGVLYELPLRYKSARQPQEKLRIAREAASRVADGWAIGLTGGTTTTEVARAMVERQELTIVTNALNIASELAVRPNLKLVVTGGVARAQSYGISPRAGLTTHHEIEAHTNRALVDRASQVTVVADSSKIGKVAFARICELTDVDELITDVDADADAIAAIEDAGVRVTTV